MSEGGEVADELNIFKSKDKYNVISIIIDHKHFESFYKNLNYFNSWCIIRVEHPVEY